MAKGHCEVHPHINEEYPCSLCYANDQKQARLKDENDYYKEMDDYYKNKYISEKNDFILKLLTAISVRVNALLERRRKKILKQYPF